MSFFERLTGTIDIEDEEELEEELGAQEDDVIQEDVKLAGSAELAVDVYQTSDEIIIQTMVAGVKPDDLEISITREMVTIEGKREGPRVEKDAYYHQELFWGPFIRKIILPSEVEVEEAEAIEKHGLIIITLPKLDKDRAAKIKIKSQ